VHRNRVCLSFYLRMLVYLVIYDSGWVSLEHLLLSWQLETYAAGNAPLLGRLCVSPGVVYESVVCGRGCTTALSVPTACMFVNLIGPVTLTGDARLPGRV